MKPIMLIAVMLLATACTTKPQRLEPAPLLDVVKDPLEGQNRRAFAANRVVDDLYIKPAAGFYRTVFPAPVRRSAANFTTNVLHPSYIFNELLQLDFEDAAHSTARFAINTTVGIGGLFDPAYYWWDLELRQEDLSQTLGNWGVPDGPYLVAPVVGPTTARGIFGSLANLGIGPVTNAILPDDLAVRASMVGQRTAQRRIEADDTLNDVFNSPDGYITLRSLYLQQQAAKLHEDADPYANLPDF